MANTVRMIEKQHLKINIIGAGISGLVAAKTLEEKGYKPTIIESTEEVGGRVKTDIMEGYQMDRGFQVLLDAYPEAKKHLNYESLQLQYFLPGAVVFAHGKGYKIGDPLRNLKFLLPTLFSPIGSFSDKWKIFKLNQQLKSKSAEKIFQEKEKSTLAYLTDLGFSDRIINHFFRPFFAGIFLETELQTSSRMFEFVYKMFGEGYATSPKSGIGAIPTQLQSRLKNTEVIFGKNVDSIKNESITLEGGEQLDTDFTIIAADPGRLLPRMVGTPSWKFCENLYFTTKSRKIKEPLIGLNSRSDAFVNNIFYATSLEMRKRNEDELLSVTVVKKHSLPLEDLILEVKSELERDFGITDTYFLKHYAISRALPDITDLKYRRSAGESMVMERVALAGDHQLNGSLNAAMISGELAAEVADEVLSGNKF